MMSVALTASVKIAAVPALPAGNRFGRFSVIEARVG
jgi:hypothetical protein